MNLFEKIGFCIWRRRAIAERKFWEKIKDNVEEGLRLAGFKKEYCERGISDYEYVRYIDNRKFSVEIFENGKGGYLHGFENGKRICRDEIKFRITKKTPPSYIAGRIGFMMFPYEDGEI